MSPLPGIYASQMQGHINTASLAYDSIQTVTLSSAQSSIAFSSFSSSYKHLQIRGISAGTDNTNVRMRFNGDTGSNYAYHFLSAGTGYGTNIYASAGTTQTSISAFDQQSGNSTAFNNTIIDILDYTNTNKNKVTKTISGVGYSTAGFEYVTTGLWMSTSAITSISLFPVSNNFLTGSTFALYGIKG